MFARQAFRPARTLQQHVRRYASEAPKSSGGNGVLYAGIGGAALTGGYFYLRGNGSPAQDAKKALGQATEAKKAFTGGDQGFVSLLLEKSEIINHNTKLLTFKLPEDDMESGLSVASAVITKYKGPNMEKAVIRPYTPTSDVDQKGTVDFIVKKYPNGPMSSHLHDLEPGQRLDIKGPIPKYQWSANKHEHVAMIAGGTGITPMWQVANAIFKNPEDKTKVTLIFGNVTEQDILLKKEWERLENTYPQRFRAFYVLDNPPESWQGGKGFVTKELLKTVLPEPKEGDKVKIFVCGPPGLYKAISGGKKSPQDQGELDGYLKELGYSKDQVYKF
ncbi:ferredoxin reductase-like protein [Aaosphaeria arxii CBS 175.79]|uniref:NADH-cytochrome b5 reductase n=1 Tax=Aaosphaeria arxii CBS 175.79 TaxID=1450172 RepID=A0A6A5XXX4_9PLEO|nr:ferredoxin reductase-like protein [Aaosphaeria arxii CBS 175.79]KAF2017806.1 ferredoxin reductase-like protein [Aaosphaeria arxii CBS 175.79]